MEMYALVMTMSNPAADTSAAGMLCLTGCMTGTNAGVRTLPCAVCSTPMRPPKVAPCDLEHGAHAARRNIM